MRRAISSATRVTAALARAASGQAFVEYVLLLGAVALALVVGYTLFAGTIASGVGAVEKIILGS
jgi:Flp pilus assembly pilin Flp